MDENLMSLQCSEAVVRSQDLPYSVAFTSHRLEIMYLARPYGFLIQASICLLSRWQQATAGGLVNHYYTKR